MIILGSKEKAVAVSRGKFCCPQCGTQQVYVRKKVHKYFSVYFVAVIPVEKDIGEFLECQGCGGKHNPSILQMPQISSGSNDRVV